MASSSQRQKLRGQEARPPVLSSLKSNKPRPLPSGGPSIQLTKRPKWMDCPSSMCRSAWAPLWREMTDWQPGSRDRSSPEPVMWSAWQWVFTGRERSARSRGAQRPRRIPSPHPRLPQTRSLATRLTSIQQPQPQLLDQLGVPRRSLQNRVDQNGLSGLSVTQEVCVGVARGLKHLGGGGGGRVRAQNQNPIHWGPRSPGLPSIPFLRARSRNPGHLPPPDAEVWGPSTLLHEDPGVSTF